MPFDRYVYFIVLYHKISYIIHKHPLVPSERSSDPLILIRNRYRKNGNLRKKLFETKVVDHEKLILGYFNLNKIHPQMTEL